MTSKTENEKYIDAFTAAFVAEIAQSAPPSHAAMIDALEREAENHGGTMGALYVRAIQAERWQAAYDDVQAQLDAADWSVRGAR